MKYRQMAISFSGLEVFCVDPAQTSNYLGISDQKSIESSEIILL